MPDDKETLREKILSLVEQYHAAAFPARAFAPGASAVPVSGKVFDATDMRHLVDASLDFWLTTGRFARQFEGRFAKDIFGARFALLVNSGSSANLVAVSALTSPLLDRPLKPGDEVITVAAGFPTTVNPILQNGLVPVFVDVEIPTYNAPLEALERALSPKTRAVVLAHTLGNPYDAAGVAEFCKRHGLYLVEDCCDALGSRYAGRQVGTFGDFATASFYPAHHITMGEGGCVVTSQPLLKRIAESFRDWGRDCWCDPGKDDTCGKRYGWKLGDLPQGYDHKYTYSHIGYNLKLTDMQAAVGLSQLDKLPGFIAARQANFKALHSGLQGLQDFLILPQSLPQAEPSWFGFPLSVRADAPFSRNQLVQFLEARKIGTRLIFAGNLLRQPAYQGAPRRVAEPLTNSDFVMNQSFWVGVYPGLGEPQIGYILQAFKDAVEQLKR
jgi:CDP-6-deoxy-D-xylo-4-hexulose-3-dehydrase